MPGAPDAQSAPWEGADEWETARARTVCSASRFYAYLRAEWWQATSPRWYCTAHASGSRTWRPPTSPQRRRPTRRRPAAILHPACGVQAVETADGFRTVPVATAVVQVGLERHGTVSHRSLREPGRRRRSIHDGLVTKEELEAAVKAHSGTPAYMACAPSSPERTVATSRSQTRLAPRCALWDIGSRRRSGSVLGPALAG